MPITVDIRTIADLYEAADRVKGTQEDVLYRVDEREQTSWNMDGDLMSYQGLTLTITAWPVLKRTPKGAWIDMWDKRKFICFNWNKQFACETPGRALQAYRARRRRQIGILEAQLRQARLGLMIANGPVTPPPETGGRLELPHSESQVAQPF